MNTGKNLPSIDVNSPAIYFREVITLGQALQHPEAKDLAGLQVSQLTGENVLLLREVLRARNIGIHGVNYGSDEKKIVAALQPSVDEGERVLLD